MSKIGACFAKLLPPDPGSYKIRLHQKMILFVSVLAFIVGGYSLIKWHVVGYHLLANAAWVVVIGQALACLLNKYSSLPRGVITHLSIASMAFHASSIVFLLGGIHSHHIFWVVGIIIFAYSISDMKGGFIWFLIMTSFLMLLIYLDQIQFPLPTFELTEQQQLVDIYSGYLLPTVVIGAGMAFLLKLRNNSLDAAENALNEAFNQTKTSANLSEQLVNILQQASISANTLLRSADELSTTTQKMNARCDSISEGIQHQLGTTNTVNDTLHSMGISVQESSEAMQKVRNNAEHVRQKTLASSSAMQDAIEYMKTIQSRNVDVLSYMSVISGIAEQTNLLALNAAIEAARAGDQGRGFAVVADEVRSLSVRSNESAIQIRELLDAAEKDIEKGAEIVNLSGRSLQEVAEAVEMITGEINASAERMQQQTNGINNILQQSGQMAEVCEHNALSSEGLSESANSLLEIAKRLVNLSHIMSDTVHKAEMIEEIQNNEHAGSAEFF